MDALYFLLPIVLMIIVGPILLAKYYNSMQAFEDFARERKLTYKKQERPGKRFEETVRGKLGKRELFGGSLKYKKRDDVWVKSWNLVLVPGVELPRALTVHPESLGARIRGSAGGDFEIGDPAFDLRMRVHGPAKWCLGLFDATLRKVVVDTFATYELEIAQSQIRTGTESDPPSSYQLGARLEAIERVAELIEERASSLEANIVTLALNDPIPTVRANAFCWLTEGEPSEKAHDVAEVLLDDSESELRVGAAIFLKRPDKVAELVVDSHTGALPRVEAFQWLRKQDEALALSSALDLDPGVSDTLRRQIIVLAEEQQDPLARTELLLRFVGSHFPDRAVELLRDSRVVTMDRVIERLSRAVRDDGKTVSEAMRSLEVEAPGHKAEVRRRMGRQMLYSSKSWVRVVGATLVAAYGERRDFIEIKRASNWREGLRPEARAALDEANELLQERLGLSGVRGGLTLSHERHEGTLSLTDSEQEDTVDG